MGFLSFFTCIHFHDYEIVCSVYDVNGSGDFWNQVTLVDIFYDDDGDDACHDDDEKKDEADYCYDRAPDYDDYDGDGYRRNHSMNYDGKNCV